MVMNVQMNHKSLVESHHQFDEIPLEFQLKANPLFFGFVIFTKCKINSNIKCLKSKKKKIARHF